MADLSAPPRDPLFDATLAALRDPYRYISRRACQLGSDAFETRLLLQPTLCLTGRDAARIFYDTRRFERRGASPKAVQKTLFGQRGVQGLDGEEHLHRKALFLSLVVPGRVDALVDASGDEWRRAAGRWRGGGVALYAAAQQVLTRSVCRWAGVPLADDEVEPRTRELTSLFDDAGAIGPRHLAARWARRRSERWAADFLHRIRAGRLPAITEDAAAHRIAMHRDLDGRLLEPRVAAVELLNVLRPTVAVSVYVVFVAHALHLDPERREKLRAGSHQDVEDFVHEVRRFYPFFPAVPARVREDFDWHGHRLRAGTRALLDLYGIDHDRRIWGDPEAFRPERFRDAEIGPFDLVPQGGGDPERGHRCPGEPVAIALMTRALRFLVDEIDYAVPADQDLAIDFGRLPAMPRGGFELRRVRLR